MSTNIQSGIKKIYVGQADMTKITNNIQTESKNILIKFDYENKEPRVISPISLLAAISTLGLGTHDESLDTLKNLFGTQGLTRTELIRLLNIFNSSTGIASMINLMHIDSNFALGEDYKNNLASCVEMIDSNDEGPISDATIAALNNRISRFTNGLITNFVTSEAKKSVINILNVIYFDAKWKTPFAADKTITGSFTQLDGTKVDLPLMRGSENNWYFEDENFQLGYKSYLDEYCMVIVVPKVDTSTLTTSQITDINNNVIFDINRLEDYINNTDFYNIQLQMPRFEQRYKCEENFVARVEYHHKDDQSIMKDNQTNIKEWTNSPIKMMHECVISVNETSTQAAAATGMCIRKSIGPIVKGTVQLNATRTFNYYIRHISSKTIGFAGTYNGNSN